MVFCFDITDIYVNMATGLLNSPSKARTQDFQIDTGIITWDEDHSKETSNDIGTLLTFDAT